jgi:predicted peptidase
VNGAPLGYLEYLPPGYGDGESRPLLVYLHDTAEAGDGSEAALALVKERGIPKLIAAGDWPEDRSFVVLAPQYGTVPANRHCEIAGDVAAFLDFATQQYEIDVSRVYLTGVSCGAIGLWDYLAAHGGEVVAAAVPISGHAQDALATAGCAPLATVPVWAFHGGKDDLIPPAFVEGQIDQIRACDAAASVEIELTVYPDADHDAPWSRTYDLSAGNDIYAWLLEHANKEEGVGGRLRRLLRQPAEEVVAHPFNSYRVGRSLSDISRMSSIGRSRWYSLNSNSGPQRRASYGQASAQMPQKMHRLMSSW